MPGHLGKYELLEQVGRGGMGVVYRARDPVLNREVALKVLPDVSGVDGTELQRFYIEAQAIAALRHPNIVVIYELDHAGGRPFIAMEYLPGWSLADVIRARRPYSDADKARIIGDVCLALAHAHSHGIVHRDVKPANIRLDPNGSVKLLDFGIAKFPGSSVTRSLQLLGTPSYLAPEIITGQPADARCDLFSLGATLYEWLAFKKPFEADDFGQVMWKIVHEEPPPLHKVSPGISLHLSRIVSRAMTKDPALRYQTAVEMKADINNWPNLAPTLTHINREQTLPVVSAPASTASHKGRHGRRRALMLATFAIVTVILLATAVMGFRRTSSVAPPPSVALIPSRPLASGVPLVPLPAGDLTRSTRKSSRVDTPREHPAATAALPTPAPEPPPVVDEEDPGPEVIAPIGTRLYATLIDEINSDRVAVGDRFRAVLDESLRVRDRTIAEAGALLSGQVHLVRRGVGEPLIELSVMSIQIGARNVPIRTGVYRVMAPPSSSSGVNIRTLIIGAAAGAALGAASGGKSGAVLGGAVGGIVGSRIGRSADTVYLSGTHLAFKLAEPIIGPASR